MIEIKLSTIKQMTCRIRNHVLIYSRQINIKPIILTVFFLLFRSPNFLFVAYTRVSKLYGFAWVGFVQSERKKKIIDENKFF